MFAYTWMWPEQGVLLFGIIPFKMKYLGWYELFVWVVQFLMGSLPTKISLVLSLLGFLVFFGREVFDWCRDTLTWLQAPPATGKTATADRLRTPSAKR